MLDLLETGGGLTSFGYLDLGEAVLLKVLLGNSGVFGEFSRSVLP